MNSRKKKDQCDIDEVTKDAINEEKEIKVGELTIIDRRKKDSRLIKEAKITFKDQYAARDITSLIKKIIRLVKAIDAFMS